MIKAKPLLLLLPGLIFALGYALPARAGWDEGVAAFTSKNYERAAREFQAIVRQDPGEWMGHYLLGVSLANLERKEEALHHLRKAYDLNPNDLSVKVALGAAYSDAGQHADAQIVLEESMKPVWRQLGFVYEKQKKYAQAIEAFEAAGDRESAARVRKLTRRR